MCERKYNNLILFTSQFPFGKVGETFLETEIIYLANYFDTVYIIPTSTESTFRTLPSNVILKTEYSDLKFSKTEKIKLLLCHFYLVCCILFSEIRSKGLKVCIRNKSVLLDYLGEQLAFKRQIEKFVLKEMEHAVFYDYWFSNKTLALAMMKKKYTSLRCVTRAHGFDLYDERWGEVGVPFRRFKTRYLDKIFFISQHGYDYFKTKVPTNYLSKMYISRLGILEYKKEDVEIENPIPTIVSITRVVSFKNVNKIPSLLSSLGRDVKWILFGDGEGMDEVIRECKKLPSNVKVELKGHVENQEMLDFLRTNHVDLLLSLSSSEGLPVSMMEVQSFGIPIVSTAVGGVPEIVIDGKTGFLIYNECEALEKLRMALDHTFSEEEIKNFFNEHFNASINYANFAKSLCYLEN